MSAHYMLGALLGAMCIALLNPHNTQIDNGIKQTVQIRKLKLRKGKYLVQHHVTHQLCDLGPVT